MRRRLVGVGLATTLLVVISTIVPLGLLVRRQAEDRARVEAERQAQATAAAVALALVADAGPDPLAQLADGAGPGLLIALPDGSVLGEPEPGQGSLLGTAMERQATVTAEVDGGWEIALPVVGVEGTVVVSAFATDDELRAGVLQAWLLLAMLGAFLAGTAGIVSDRLGRRLVVPMSALAETAHQLGSGDLSARVPDLGDAPEEIEAVGEALDSLADRVDELLQAEREAAADLSHRLRTPITSLRLQAEKVADDADRARVLQHVARLEAAVDDVITATRASSGHRTTELDPAVARRAAFWKVLADEQARAFEVALDAPGVSVGLAPDDLGAIIDVLIDNVFAHTPDGTGFSLITKRDGDGVVLEVTDTGPGFESAAVVDRGTSGRGSSGLGLDIARSGAERLGGTLQLDDRPGGGAVVRLRIPEV